MKSEGSPFRSYKNSVLIVKYWVVILVFNLLITENSFSQKAYDAIYYTGKTQNVLVKFTFASGYTEGCEIKTVDLKTKKTSRFLPDFDFKDEINEMKFYHVSSTIGKIFSDYFIIDGIIELEDVVPDEFSGAYYFKGKKYPILLKRI